MISARQVKSLRARYGTAGNKDDRFDAFVLADALRTDAGRWSIVRPDQPTIRSRYGCLSGPGRTWSGTGSRSPTSCWPCSSTISPARSACSASSISRISLAFLRRFPTEARAAWLSRMRMAHWLKANSYCGRHTPSHLMDHLRPGSHRPAPRDAAADASESSFSRLVDLLRPPCASSRSGPRGQDQGSASGAPRRPDLHSLPRAGTVRAATLLAEIGDCRARFPDPAALAAAAGRGALDPTVRKVPQRRLPPRLQQPTAGRAHRLGPRHPRANAWADDTYDRARAPRLPPPPRQQGSWPKAWTRILWRCWHDHTPYNPDLHGRLTHLTTSPA